MRKLNNDGFTLIELFIVLVIIGILGTLVAMTYSGIQAKNRNNERQATIKSLQGELEAYYALHSTYPTLQNLNDDTWITKNFKDFKPDTLKDPSWNKNAKDCTADSTSVVTATVAAKCYTYQATTTDGSACDNDKNPCAQYTLTAVLEGGEKYVKSSLN